MEKRSRVTYVDIARLAAAFAVVLLHTAGLRLSLCEPESGKFFWAAAFDCFARWSVPLFIMISGMLFLGREVDIKKLWTKNIFRLVTAFIFWSYLYNLYTARAAGGGAEIFLTALKKMPGGAMHLWFIFVILGLYVVTPFISRMTKNMTKREAEYFLLVNLLVTFLPNTINYEPLTQYIGRFEIFYAAGYAGFFVAGWYIHNFDHSPLFRRISYTAAVLAYILMVFLTVFLSRAEGTLWEGFMSFKGVLSYAMAFGAMMFFKYAFGRREYKKRTASNLAHWSKYTFGVYLVHEMIISLLSGRGFVLLENQPYLGIPLEAAAVFALSFLISAVIDLTPLSKYII